MVSSTLCPAVHILGSQNVYGRVEGIADHYWPWAVFCFHFRPPRGLLAGSEALPAGSEALPAGFEAHPALSEALPVLHLPRRLSKLAWRPSQLDSRPSPLALKSSQVVLRTKDGPGPVMVSNTLCPAVHILGT